MNLRPFPHIVILFFVALAFLTSCKKDEESAPVAKSQVVNEYKIAVIYPMSDYGNGSITRTVNWALENLKSAQYGFDTAISISVEWYNENTDDLEQLGLDLRLRPYIMAVVGPLYSSNVDIIASKLMGTRKTLIPPCATSAELVRDYSGKNFFWSISETDITQCEVLLSRAVLNGSKDVSLLVSNDIYGQTFIDWFAFQATEMGLNVNGIFIYEPGEGNVQDAIKDAFEHSYTLICAIADPDDIRAVIQASDGNPAAPYIIFSDGAFIPDVLDMGEVADYLEGVTLSSDPESGFEVAYKVHFNESPKYNEAHYYDAVMLAALAICDVDCKRVKNVNDAMSDITATASEDGSPRSPLTTWTDDGMRRAMQAMREGREGYNIKGATGSLDFDAHIKTTVVHSTYSNWLVYKGRFVSLGHLSSDGSRRTEATLSSWNWRATVLQQWDESASISISYPPLEDNWALIVAGSESWKNYRHQADALNVYSILKRFGLDDDHIILIMKDDIANNPESPFPGQVLRYDGVNLYQDVHLDYNLDDITADDFEKILTGQSSQRLPHVINATMHDNILVFWSGHGEPGSLLLGERGIENGLTTERMASLLNAMRSRQCYRKVLWLIETCYSASVASAAEGEEIPGMLMLTAAGPYETSKASQKIDGVYRTNRFTELLTETLRQNPAISYRNLYYELSTKTTGSHVTMLNASRFDNIFSASPIEFLPQN